MNTSQTFNLPEGYDYRQVIDDLTNDYSLRPDRTTSENLVFLDTFDWRVFNRSLVLYRRNNKLCLRQLFQADLSQSVQVSAPPVFAQDIPAGKLKELVAPLIQMRALLERAKVQIQSVSYRLLNQDEKTVVRLVYQAICQPSGAR